MNENEKINFTGESFGADCPDNWEDIVAALNDIVDRDNIVDKDEAEALWDEWCCHGLDGVPDPIFSEEKTAGETTMKYTDPNNRRNKLFFEVRSDYADGGFLHVYVSTISASEKPQDTEDRFPFCDRYVSYYDTFEATFAAVQNACAAPPAYRVTWNTDFHASIN